MYIYDIHITHMYMSYMYVYIYCTFPTAPSEVTVCSGVVWKVKLERRRSITTSTIVQIITYPTFDVVYLSKQIR